MFKRNLILFILNIHIYFSFINIFNIYYIK
jgi:hypothetical protein